MVENNESRTIFLFRTNDKFVTIHEKAYLSTLEICLKYNNLDFFIIGAYGPKQSLFGELAFNYDLAVRAIYHVYAEKNVNIVKDLVEAMNKIYYTTRNFEVLQKLMFFCNAHMYYANKGEAPFKIDVKKVYQGIKNNLDKNKDFYDTYSGNMVLKAVKEMVEKYD